MAIRAQVRDILRLIAMQAGVPVTAGICAGVVLTFALRRYIETLLFEIAPADPVTLLGAPLALFAASLLAIVRPARNAARLDPVRALRDG
jgi:ABC-type antimicrobial peptide transport system permease subunit